MNQRIQIRIGNLPRYDWKADLQSQLESCALTQSVQLLDLEDQKPGSASAVDPQIVAATITGGAAIVVALIPVIVDVFRKKASPAPTVVNVTFHGTADSRSLVMPEAGLKLETLDEVFASIGQLTEVDIS